MTKIIFFDTDCISSFLWTNQESLLETIFGKLMVIPQQVYDELSRVECLKIRVDAMICNNVLTIEDIPCESEYYKQYFDLTVFSKEIRTPLIGRGEAAAIILARKYKGILASNNLRDVNHYVHLYGLQHITTSDIIHRAVVEEILSIEQADTIWVQMISKKRKLPFNTYTEYASSLVKGG